MTKRSEDTVVGSMRMKISGTAVDDFLAVGSGEGGNSRSRSKRENIVKKGTKRWEKKMGGVVTHSTGSVEAIEERVCMCARGVGLVCQRALYSEW